MKKTHATAAVVLGFLLASTSAMQAQQVDAGIFPGSGATLEIRLRPSDTVMTLPLSNVAFTIRWPTAYGVSLGTASSPVYAIAKQGAETVAGNYRYQKFAAATAQSITWSPQVEIPVLTVPVQQTGSGVGTFELVNDSWTSANNGEYYVEIAGLNKTGTIYQSSASVPLPIRLLFFSAETRESSVVLSWGTRDEGTVAVFIVERSANGSEWAVIGSVTPSDRNASGSWLFHDNSPPQNGTVGILRYRLQVVYGDGAVDYSPIVEVQTAKPEPGGFTVQVHPNPSRGRLFVTLSLPVDDRMTLRLYDRIGRSVRLCREDTPFPAGTHLLVLDTGDLAPGEYFLTVAGASSTRTVPVAVTSGS
ncbi:MAG: hypothetical protein QHI48_05600 [Bacteroidota bacterium]|nr:hypothetical protein [Bacteroidota bacterium]